MTTQEVISSGLLESYVLGTASDQETILVQDLCAKNPELIKEIEAIEAALINYSTQSVSHFNQDLKGRLITKLFPSTQEAKIISIKKNNKTIQLYKLGLAASVIFFITSAVFIVSLQKKVTQLNNELAKTTTERTGFEEQANARQTDIVTLTSELQILSDPGIKTIGLKGMNSLVSRSAVVHWNTASNALYFNAASLPASPSDKQYQLWAIVDGKPVDVGVIDRNNESVFQKMKSVKNAQAFAVTVEKAGGSAAPTMDTLCLLGNV